MPVVLLKKKKEKYAMNGGSTKKKGEIFFSTSSGILLALKFTGERSGCFPLCINLKWFMEEIVKEKKKLGAVLCLEKYHTLINY